MDMLDGYRRALEATNTLDVAVDGERLVVMRRSVIPTRRLFRLLFPRAAVRVRASSNGPLISAGPDGWAWVMMILCVGGILVELTMSRVKYPREYPPEFVYALTALVFGHVGLDLYVTRARVAQALGRR